VARDDEVLAVAGNRTETDADATAHAELLALRAATGRSGDWRLTGATLYVTLEPCAMCFGAVLQTHLSRVVYGADNVREGALGTVMDLAHGPWKRQPEVRGGVLPGESARLLQAFFRGRRSAAG
jgi:tRNA(adenine34) deaminase